jgi:hypothetical protein
MSDDFLDRVNQAGQNWFGEDRGPDEIKRDFHLYGQSKRAEALDQLDEHLRTQTELKGEGEIRSFARLSRLRRELGGMHQTLMKVRR